MRLLFQRSKITINQPLLSGLNDRTLQKPAAGTLPEQCRVSPNWFWHSGPRCLSQSQLRKITCEVWIKTCWLQEMQTEQRAPMKRLLVIISHPVAFPWLCVPVPCEVKVINCWRASKYEKQDYLDKSSFPGGILCFNSTSALHKAGEINIITLRK